MDYTIHWERTKGIITPNGKEKYLYKIELEKLQEIVKQLDEEKETSILRIISIVGDRGTGKTSLLYAASTALQADHLVLPVIDPSEFGTKQSVLELVMAELYSHVTREEREKSVPLDNEKRDIVDEIKQLTKTLRVLRIDDSRFSENNSDIETLKELADRRRFSAALRRVVEKIVAMENSVRVKAKEQGNCRSIVVCIDDMDLAENSRIYSLLEDIRQYLAGSITVLLGYREEQLRSAVLQSKLSENKPLLDQGLVSTDELKLQSAKYIEKLAPFSQRVYLSSGEDLRARPLRAIVEPLMENTSDFRAAFIDNFTEKEENLSIDEWLQDAVFARTRLKISPLDQTENTHLNLPDNLRGLLVLLEMVYTMQPLYTEEEAQNIHPEACLHNLATYRTYLLSQAQETLTPENNTMLRNWMATPPEAKNHFLYHVLWQRFKPENRPDDLLCIDQIEPYNVCIADVHEILEAFKQSCVREKGDYYFIYLLKMLYSLTLLELFLRSCTEPEPSAKIDYLKIINALLMPENYEYTPSFTPVFEYHGEIADFDGIELGDVTLEHAQEMYQHMVRFFGYSAQTAEGNIRQVARRRSGETSALRRNTNYRYRRMFEYEDIEYERTRKYKYDPFTIFAGGNHLEAAKNDMRYYVFYNMFDLDVFHSIIFDPKKPGTEFGFILRKIRSLIQLGVQRREELDMAAYLALPLGIRFPHGNRKDTILPYDEYTEGQFADIFQQAALRSAPRPAKEEKTETVGDMDFYYATVKERVNKKEANIDGFHAESAINKWDFLAIVEKVMAYIAVNEKHGALKQQFITELEQMRAAIMPDRIYAKRVQRDRLAEIILGYEINELDALEALKELPLPQQSA